MHDQLTLPLQIVHLDIKSSNILLMRVNRKITAKVADVGIAKEMSSGEGVVLTQVRRARFCLWSTLLDSFGTEAAEHCMPWQVLKSRRLHQAHQ